MSLPKITLKTAHFSTGCYENSFRGGVHVGFKPVSSANPGTVEQVEALLAPGGQSHYHPLRQGTFRGVGLPPALVDQLFSEQRYLEGLYIG